MGKIRAILPWLLQGTFPCLFILILSSDLIADQKETYKWLNRRMDRFHKTFDVYTDISAAGNHFVCHGKMGDLDAVEMDGCWIEDPHRGSTCIRCVFENSGNNWGGFYFLNGVLEGEERQPKPNWGDYCEAGFDLSGATELTFWAKGQSGNEVIEFFAFGVGHPDKPCPDSSPKKSLGWVPLSTDWEQHRLPLAGMDLSYVIGGFGWVASSAHSRGPEVVFYLDDIKYHLDDQTRQQRLSEPRFILSYDTDGYARDFDRIMTNVAFTYDNALALIAYLARGKNGDLRRAELLADALVYAQDHDRWFKDGRLRNAYQAGDLKLFPGWKPHGQPWTVRMPGWWDCEDEQWYEDLAQVSTYTGNVAWAMIALSYAAHAIPPKAAGYNDAAKRMGEWIQDHCHDENGYGGYTGGYEGWELAWAGHDGPIKLWWKSTEHNLDCYVAFSLLSEIFPDEPDGWKERAAHARAFVEAMWNDTEKRFFVGTRRENGDDIINEDPNIVDVQAWSVLALRDSKFNPCLKWAERNLKLKHCGFKGFDFGYDNVTETGPDGIWFEGTGQMVVAYGLTGKTKKYERFLKRLRKAKGRHPNGNGRGLVAACHDGVTTGLEIRIVDAEGEEDWVPWLLYARLHTGATAWYLFAERKFDPFWGESLK